MVDCRKIMKAAAGPTGTRPIGRRIARQAFEGH